MRDFEQKIILRSLTNQRKSLAWIRKRILISGTDIEVLAYAKTKKLFSVYELKKFYAEINIQQLRSAVTRLEDNGFLELTSKGIKNKPSIYWLSRKGEELIDFYIKMIA
jgi:predicted transcriptional regulator of viral defense system